MGDTLAHQRLSLEGARKVADAAVAEALRLDVPMCLAITDNAGLPILTLRMDRAPFASGPIAYDKARSVVGFNAFSTAEWWPSIEDDPSLVHGITHTPGLVIFAGGLGIFIDGELVGAIGASGGSTTEDQSVAAAGIAAL